MSKENIKRRQLDRVYDLLLSPNPEGFTRMQVARCLGIERASVCRRVAELQEEGKLWVVRKGIDPLTKERAEFLTCNPNVARSTDAKEKPAPASNEQTGFLF